MRGGTITEVLDYLPGCGNSGTVVVAVPTGVFVKALVTFFRDDAKWYQPGEKGENE
jgi:hypothetical protein